MKCKHCGGTGKVKEDKSNLRLLGKTIKRRDVDKYQLLTEYRKGRYTVMIACLLGMEGCGEMTAEEIENEFDIITA